MRASHRSRVGSDSRPKRSNTAARPCRDLTGFLLRENILTIGRGSPLCQMPVRCHDFETAILGRLRWLVPATPAAWRCQPFRLAAIVNCSIFSCWRDKPEGRFSCCSPTVRGADCSKINRSLNSEVCQRWGPDTTTARHRRSSGPTTLVTNVDPSTEVWVPLPAASSAADAAQAGNS